LKVALVVPKCDLILSTHSPPINLCYIASYLRKTLPDVEIKLFDGSVGDDPESCIADFQPNIVGVSATTPQAPSAYRLGDKVKQRWSNILTVIGGVHASIMPQEAQEHFDLVVVGEGEKTFSQIVQNFNGQKPKKEIIQGQVIENLDEIPPPTFDLIKIQEYLQHGINLPSLKPPVMGMVTSRGCPFRCAFCWNCFRKTKIRYFSAERIVEDILFLRKEYGVERICFLDDEFLINKERINQLSVLFEKHGISSWLKWACNARATTVTVPLLKMVKDMGCVMVLFGLESGNERMLNYLKAGSVKLADNDNALKIAKEAGISAGGSFIFGTPTETLEEMEESFNWIVNHPSLKLIGISILAPYPGTDVFNLSIEKGLMTKDIDYEKLIQDASPEINTLLVTTVPHKKFIKFMKKVNNATWFMNKVRLAPSSKNFLRMFLYPTSWGVFVNNPRLVINEIRNLSNHRN
jgi:anaerobic magnesium-protoporphyrin IX monomethyl ester cyclase